MNNTDVAVITFGSPLVGYDAVGDDAYDTLEKAGVDRRALLINGGARSLETLQGLEGVRKAVLIDAISGNGALGTIVRMTEQELHATTESETALLSLHDRTLTGALQLLRLVNWQLPEEIIFLGVYVDLDNDDLESPLFDEAALLGAVNAELHISH